MTIINKIMLGVCALLVLFAGADFLNGKYGMCVFCLLVAIFGIADNWPAENNETEDDDL